MRTVGIRQQPGFACEECRRRKARCDRTQPQCGTCTEFNITCITMDKRPRRGPKRGQVEMMRSRIAMLESELEKQAGRRESEAAAAITPNSDVPVTGVSMTAASTPSLMAKSEQAYFFTDMQGFSDLFSDQISGLNTQPYLSWSGTQTIREAAAEGCTVETQDGDGNLASPNPLSAVFSEGFDMGDIGSVMGPSGPEVTDLIRADLSSNRDDLYFERVHKICPMVHQQRYFSWASQENPSRARVCLRSSMRTLAAAMSAPYQGFVDVLYSESRHLLDEYRRASGAAGSLDRREKVEIEYAQAWLLLAHYESLRADEWQTMLTAGTAFRLVQMTRLHETDIASPAPSTTTTASTFAEMEEMRRTFWVAYTLDHFLCWQHKWPLTLYEDMASTIRLPAPETNFQNNQPITTDCLSETMAKGDQEAMSPFSECVVLATLHHRCTARQRPRGRDRGVAGRQELLSVSVEGRLKLLQQSQTTQAVERDPMAFFTHFLALSTLIELGSSGSAQDSIAHSQAPQQHRASVAVTEMLRLAKTLPLFSGFKAHPFLPRPLATGVAFLSGQGCPRDRGDAFMGSEALLKVLQDLHFAGLPQPGLALGPVAANDVLPGRRVVEELVPVVLAEPLGGGVDLAHHLARDPVDQGVVRGLAPGHRHADDD
ncbi:fungal-specific transcription factor domain-containing protein [Apiospora saccharicola]|uniref:Fungal-specific transcription factor domain-containing protein n=1 Tax=Apiospora saccharicola TaxID=335842 RepID=A0ABR1W0R7_9PEZI